MPPSDPADRHIAAVIASNVRWAHEPDRSAATRPARDAFERRFLDEVDPERTLSPAERERRAANARTAYFYALAAKSAKARKRSERKRSGGADDVA